MNPYLSLLVFAVVVTGFALTMIALSMWLGPKNRSVTKQLPWECGAVSVGDAATQRFNVRFYLVALLFVLFDVEVVLLYPWAVDVAKFGWGGLTLVAGFSVIVFTGFVYVVRRGVLDWNR